jgi:hypothetical protein
MCGVKDNKSVRENEFNKVEHLTEYHLQFRQPRESVLESPSKLKGQPVQGNLQKYYRSAKETF